MSLTITDEDIDRVEPLLLSSGEKFDTTYRRPFIKNLSTVDVNACPGSGKTTALLAKIMILAEKMPFDDGRGICVLTHTNVAIDEIKEKLGVKSNVLFSHPNFFGTFQKFIDRYLTIPAYIEMFGYRPLRIDDEYYADRLSFQYSQLLDKTKGWLAQKGRNAQKSGFEYFRDTIGIRFDGNDKTYVNKYNDETLLKNPLKDTYIQIDTVKMFIMKEGYLTYDDAYSLAIWYLKKRTELIKYFQSRFSFIFIDEMQDTDKRQNEIIDTIFNENCIIQKIGDPCQAIYSSVREEQIWTPSSSSLPLPESKRFGTEIANRIKIICTDSTNALVGNSAIPSSRPYLIVFDNSSIASVFETFARLIKEKELDKNTIISPEKRLFSAIGWVGKDKKNPKKQNLCIKSYFPEYQYSAQSKTNKNWPSLKLYLSSVIKKPCPDDYKTCILNGLIKILRIADRKNEQNSGKHFTEKSLLLYISEKDLANKLRFLENIAFWCRLRLENKDITDLVRKYVKDDFAPFMGVEYNAIIAFVMKENDAAVAIETAICKSTNQFISTAFPEIKIDVKTIHSAKGQTHTATLYLETFFQGKHESEWLIEQMKGSSYVPSVRLKDTYKKNALKMAYVGMSRPTHLLCVAMHKDRITSHRTKLQSLWNVIDA